MKWTCLAPALPLLALLTATVPARAETTGWVVNDGGRMRMIALPPQADGTVQAVLEIAPQKDWITYWREPGDSGIPPQISATGGAVLRSVAYPVPTILTLGKLTDIGYDNAVSLPILLEKVTGETEISVFIGICNRICVPFQASFSLDLQQAAINPIEVSRVERALAGLPAPPSADFRVEHLTGGDGALSLHLTLPKGAGDVEAIVTGPPGLVLTARGTAADKAPTTLSLPLARLPAAFDAKTARWKILVKAAGRAIETEMPVE